ncbi:MAG: MSHA biogenesis protein MshE, partial [Dehalococcoidia bacterium]|nr:MSHA biogenesis protein MshE [Dehalococcoidia bacterium]
MEATKTNLAKDLGQLLVEAKLITEEQLRHVKELQLKRGDKFERILLQERLVTPQQLAFFNSLQLRLPFVNLRKEGVESGAIALVPEDV